jgi:hypothetical protein
MIQFSVFLQENDRKKAKADEQIKQQNELLIQKEKEIERKQKQLEILQQKSKRISLKREAIMKYERYLENVQQSNTDEFEDIGTILTRYNTLIDSNKNLQKKNHLLEEEAEKKKLEIVQYNADMKERIM